MLSIDLVSQDEFSLEDLEVLKPRELLYIRLKTLTDVSDELIGLISKGTQYSSEVYLSIPDTDYDNKDLRKKFLNLGIKGFALRLTHNITNWLKHEGTGQHNSGDRDLVYKFGRDRKELPAGKELVAEFQIGDDTRVLAPTIAGVHLEGAKWVVLNIEGDPTPKKCSQMRDVLEYLKIRGCTRLNVYFPFWNPHFREWDTKTQNTFSGLQIVHIDISNRCTHSCIFCGLYGPDPVEEQKKHGNGSLPEPIANLMKMEIAGDKCLDIINSLPWSVRMIQFGGYGDPLMHEKAVDFIVAARERGFHIEMLSNMEYLDDEKIRRLHSLGSKDIHDFHFIANISGADPEIYVKTRPKQTFKNFDKIIHNLNHFSKLKKASDGVGVHFTLMCVVNTVNCQYLAEMAHLADRIGASRIWFKPMEIHSSHHYKYIPAPSQMKTMARSLAAAVAFADEKGIFVMQRDFCEEIIRTHSGEVVNV